jgi:hypothetical protein
LRHAPQAFSADVGAIDTSRTFRPLTMAGAFHWGWTMVRLRMLSVVAALVVGEACADVATSPEPSVIGSGAPSIIEPCEQRDGCEEPPPPSPPAWPPFGTVGDELYQAPGDPNPGQPGIYLGASVTPDACFADFNLSIADSDKDWLADHCELELARGFAPTWGLALNDGCPGAEPLWAAKYFPNQRIVRIAFLPAYYDDCGGGSFGDHRGDSEFVMAEVRYDAATQHWRLEMLFLSAHHGAPFYHRSAWLNTPWVHFNKRYAAHPMVHVARRKHANYGSDSSCDDGSVDSCEAYYRFFRFPIDPNRNLGSRHVKLVDCVSSYGALAGSPRQECIWSYSEFCGWHPTQTTCSGPYYSWLHGGHFESYSGDLGPGPGPPTTMANDPYLGGSSHLAAGEYGNWWVNWPGQTLSSCAWYVDGAFVQQGSCSFSWAFHDAPSVHSVYASVTRADGITRPTPEYNVNVSGSGNGGFYSRVGTERPQQQPSRTRRGVAIPQRP